MWKDWDKYVDTEDTKRYELLVGTKFQVLLGVYITKDSSHSKNWAVLINAFAPSAGETIIYEGSFQSLQEAERVAWENAQHAVNIRSDL